MMNLWIWVIGISVTHMREKKIILRSNYILTFQSFIWSESVTAHYRKENFFELLTK